jgi:hypothetical protein
MLIWWRWPAANHAMRHFCALDAPRAGKSCATPSLALNGHKSISINPKTYAALMR